MTDTPIKHLQEKVLAGNLLTAGAGVSARVIDNFVSWLVGGAGAALTLIVTNLSETQPYLSVLAVKIAAVFFLLAAGLTVLEKYLASLLMGAAESCAHAAEAGRRLAEDKVELDFDVVFREVEAATLPPMRWFVGRSFDKVKEGDFSASGRNFARCAQLQGLIALLIALLVLGTIGLVVCALGS